MEASSFSGSSKRGKAPGNIGQVAHCLVDGCSADLSQCRDYHRRHKVCEVHSKTPKVTIGGREQRFCQQCSRFHSLVEFDEGKRSCRKRLDGHNRRRRKPQAVDLCSQRANNISGGTRLVSFSSAPQIVLPSAVVGYSWSGVEKPENEQQQQQQQQMSYMDAAAAAPPPLPASSYHHPKCSSSAQLQFVQGTDSAIICRPFMEDPNGATSSSQRMFSHSDGALSLLSSREFGLKQLPEAPDYSGLGHFHHLPHQTKPPAEVSSAASTLHFPEMFQQGSSTPGCGSHQTLSFMWK